VGTRTGLGGRKISSPAGFDPGPSSPWSVAIPTELPDTILYYKILLLLFSDMFLGGEQRQDISGTGSVLIFRTLLAAW